MSKATLIRALEHHGVEWVEQDGDIIALELLAYGLGEWKVFPGGVPSVREVRDWLGY
jgi:hypothetical protein